MSIPDQYLLRTGFTFQPGGGRVAWSLGGRWEGIPVRDILGADTGFRRPGYAVSVEPGFSYTWGSNTFSVAVPYALQRNRQQSVPDKVTGRRGDAAFADWIISLGYWRRF
jgi:hypothetical protein